MYMKNNPPVASKKLNQIVEPLLLWYEKNARVLPWRENSEPYRVWLSEIMLQQTRVEAVKPYYERFLAAFPNVAALACAPEDRLLKLWEGLGYYSRVRNLQKAARQVMEEYDGALPGEYEQLKKLPGIGEYTAGAIASIAFHQRVPVVDGNVLRVISRITGSRESIDASACKKRIWQELSQVVPAKCPGDFNQALMELGATVCLPGGRPLCAACPLQTQCFANLKDETGEIPVRDPKKEKKCEQRTVLLLWQDGKVALRRRPSKGLLGGMWEFPSLEGHLSGVEVERQLRNMGIKSRKVERLPDSRHVFTHIIWEMIGYRAELDACSPAAELEFWSPRALRKEAAMPSAFAAYTALIREGEE